MRIFINLKLSALQDLFDKMGNSPESSFMVTNKNGILITRSDKPDAFMDAASGAEFMGKVMNSGTDSGSFVASMNGSKSLITYTYNDKLEWYLVNATICLFGSRELYSPAKHHHRILADAFGMLCGNDPDEP
ncbi:hypothetical protein VQ056_11790 [Paenibacillus sp. JTLBN-2024]